MRLDDFHSDREFTEDCNKLSIKLFAFYAKGRLNRQEERLIDAHCINCGDCRANLAYVFDIIKGREKLSADGQTLLLKYLQDPIYKDTLEKLKDTIKEEILSEIKPTLLAESLLPKSTVLTSELIKNHFSNTPNLQNTSTSNAGKIPNNKDGKKAFLFFKTLKTKLREITSQQFNYFYFASACLFAVVLSLSIFTYLALSSKTKQQSSISNFSSYENPVIQSIAQQNKQVTSNLYQQLDTAIDQYLSSKNIDDLNKAEATARDIEDKYSDKYGIDLIAYYQASPKSAIEKLQTCRKQMFSLINQANGDNYKQRLDDSLALSNSLFALGNLPETYRTKFLIAKLYAKTYKYEECNRLISEGITFSEKNHYLMLQGYFLLWKAKNTSLTGNFPDTEQTFKSVINIGQRIEINELVVNPAMTLTGLYQMRDEDQKALETAQSVLPNLNQSDTNIELIIGLKQMAGLAAFKLGFSDLADSYLYDAIELSEKSKNPYLIATSYTFLGLTLAETKNFVQSQEAYSKAQTAVLQIQEEDTRLDALSIVLGYQAKAKLLEGDFQQTANLYRETLSIIEKLGIKSNLEASQLNEGLAIALQKIQLNKESQEHFALASHYKTLAISKHEQSNCLLSYLPSACYIGK